jgi:hypothetical protein
MMYSVAMMEMVVNGAGTHISTLVQLRRAVDVRNKSENYSALTNGFSGSL